MKLKTLTMMLVLAFRLPFAAAQLPASEQSPDWYRNAWQEREQQARMPEKRAALAKNLLDAAADAGEKDHKLLLAHKAYIWGSRDLEGYVSAADALNFIQKTDPSQRVWCLERMAGLYESAYRARPTKLRLGSGCGETLIELAKQRQDDATSGFEDGTLSTADSITMLRQCQGDLQRAVAALTAPMRRAQADARKVIAMGHQDRAPSLEKFAAEMQDQIDGLTDLRNDVSRRQILMMQLRGAENRFKSRPTSATAEPLAIMYVAQFDQPERVDPAVIKQLTEDTARNLALSCRRPDDLTADQAAAMSKWYLGLVNEAGTDSAKLAMAIRCGLYAKQALASGNTSGRSLLDKAYAAASPLGAQNGAFDGRMHDLNARLNWQYKPATTVAVNTSKPKPDKTTVTPTPPDTTTTTDTHTTDTTTSHTDTTTSPDTTTSTSTTATDNTATTTTGTDTGTDNTPAKVVMRNGRPMTICAKCGREFFAGWDNTADQVCPRCRSGHKNIFDFGND